MWKGIPLSAEIAIQGLIRKFVIEYPKANDLRINLPTPGLRTTIVFAFLVSIANKSYSLLF